MVPRVVETLKLVLEDEQASWIANGLRHFAYRNPAEAAALVPNIVAALPEADAGDKVDLAIALRSIGPHAASAAGALRRLLRDNCHGVIVRVHVASALASIEPTDGQSCGFLLSCLSDKSEHVRWVAAWALARSRIGDPRFPPVLTMLLKDHDVRVRVSAADALWEITNDSAQLVPILIASLSADHEALTTDFTYPSYSGESHRVYALLTLGRIGQGARQAIPAILTNIEEAAANDRQNDRIAYAGLVSLAALAKLGPHEPEVLARVKAIRDRKGGFVERSPELAEEAVKAIEMNSPSQNR